MVFKHLNGVTLIGGAFVDDENCNQALRLAPHLYCADGGLNQAPYSPLAVIGDFDSCDCQSQAFLQTKTLFVDDQNTTDFEKCLVNIEAEFFLCLGFLEGRMDHHFASFNTVMKFSDKAVFLLGQTEFCFLLPKTLHLDLPDQTPFSIFPFTPTSATSLGLKWAIDGLNLAPDDRIATSNITKGIKVEIKIQSGKAIAILPSIHLTSVIHQLYPSSKM